MGLESEAKAGWNAIKGHVLFFIVAALVVAALVLAYDAKHEGKATKFFAGLPGIKSLFTAFALFLGPLLLRFVLAGVVIGLLGAAGA